MPFLHWDLENLRSRRGRVVKATVPGHERLFNPAWDHSDEQSLLGAYLTNHHPLHIRRTLDQYYYHTLKDTSERDQDQVVSRYQQSTELQPRILTMVDQLWIWVLGGAGSQPDTVVTCFPHVERDPNPNAPTSVLRRIKRSLLGTPFRIQTAHDLAGLIAATCSRVYLDPGSTIPMELNSGRRSEFQAGPTNLQFAELYGTEISGIVSCVLFCLGTSPSHGAYLRMWRIKDPRGGCLVRQLCSSQQRRCRRHFGRDQAALPTQGCAQRAEHYTNPVCRPAESPQNHGRHCQIY